MEKDYNRGISQEQLEAIKKQVTGLAEETFTNLNLSADLVEAAQMQLLKITISPGECEITQEFVATNLFPRAVTGVFRDYQMTCYRICLARTQDKELSEDLAQDAIKYLLSSRKRVEKVRAWLARVIYYLLYAHYRKTDKEERLFLMLSLEPTPFEQWLLSEDFMEMREVYPTLVDQLLQSDEYKQYDEITSYDSIKEYAAAHHISEKLAQKRKNLTLRNLKSKALRSMGWRCSPNILNYRQYEAIQRFIREVQRMCSGDESIKWIKSLSPEHIETMKKIQKVAEWGITATGEYGYRLLLFTFLEDGEQFVITFNIALSKRNSVSIQSYKANIYVNSHTIPAGKHIPKNKGMAALSYEQIISLLKGN